MRLPARRGVGARGGGGHAQVGRRRRRRVVQGRRAEAAVARVAAKVRGRFLREKKIGVHLPNCSPKWHLTPTTPIPRKPITAPEGNSRANARSSSFKLQNYLPLLTVRNINNVMLQDC